MMDDGPRCVADCTCADDHHFEWNDHGYGGFFITGLPAHFADFEGGVAGLVALQEGKMLADLPPAEFFSNQAIVAAIVGKRTGK